ncbi:MAG: CPBP family intramembrane metalloprotease [Xanthomonadales bacterium]|nr:CPBP family intramembrane metalloprotease [Xanthomonadales bacterium]NIN60273.1 CPBP family intramembrane metalloprotease [Xanthomonadales bacterium]NIP12666.1 CPBP family intramembrane metalloprotease [Xanthomonadales bacterium]NIP75814.1 CPBP family intramembrane metalloprotease [Xanthomonadales bacterium]NIT09031.1 CPBP family intramembrane metalloprotease [Xanthomonadales bacterium]
MEGWRLLLPALAFGLAHSYQGVAGMISTGLVGLILGALFIGAGGNLWLPILVHGVANSIGITLIFTNADRLLGTLLFH